MRSTSPTSTSRSRGAAGRRTSVIRAALLLLAIVPAIAFAGPADRAPAPAAARFAAMKTLVGTWRTADRPGSALRIRFSLTAGGSVLVEEWLRGTDPHSITIYHRDGDGLLATHYCPQSNQPRLALVPSADATTLRFAFRDATDLDRATESFLVALSFDLANPERPVRRESYRQGGVDSPSELTLVRDR